MNDGYIHNEMDPNADTSNLSYFIFYLMNHLIDSCFWNTQVFKGINHSVLTLGSSVE